MKYNVSGMSCAACAARIEKAVNGVEGVKECSVSLLTNSMNVDGDFLSEAVVNAVEKAGYGAKPSSDESLQNSSSRMENNEDLDSLSFTAEINQLKVRLIYSAVLLCVLMYFSMGHMMWNFKVPAFLEGNPAGLALVQLLISTVIMLINRKFFINGFKTLFHLSPTMDTLVALGSGVSWLYSLVMLFGMTSALSKGIQKEVMYFMNNLYFEGAATIVTLITTGKLLEAVSKGRTTDALKSLMKLSPETAVLLVTENGAEKEVVIPAKQVKKGDIFIVRPGAIIPADGVVIEGNSAVNESALTGESVPVDKSAGSSVSAGTINTNGIIRCTAEKTGKDTALSQIITLVSESAASKAPVARIADKVSGVFVPFVIAAAFLTAVVWLILGAEAGYALSRGICVLVVSCPCALGLAAPVAIMVANGKGAVNGILFKTSTALENAGRTKIVVFDKTGTLTTGDMKVCDAFLFDGHAGFTAVVLSDLPRKGASLASPTLSAGLQSLMQTALNLEKSSEHPLAKAVVSFAEEQGFKAQQISEFEATGGKGVKCLIEQNASKDGSKSWIFGGNVLYIKENIPVEKSIMELIQSKVDEVSAEGKTPLVFVSKTEEADSTCKIEVSGIIALSDTVKVDSKEAVQKLQKAGIRTVMLTGDNQYTAKSVAEECGIKEYYAGVLPAEKDKKVRELMKEGPVAMVGDGINDAPALTAADTGIAIGRGTDVALDSADVILMNNTLMDVSSAITLSRKTLRTIHQNFFWAFAYNVLLIPVAAGVYVKAGIQMNPMFGALAMSLSSFCVVANALRLNLVKIKNKTKGSTESTVKEKNMEKTIGVEGMMCAHCEAHVKEALEKIGGVKSAAADHEKNCVVLELTAEVDDSVLKSAVEGAGYKFIG